jgi:hypothetical protein
VVSRLAGEVEAAARLLSGGGICDWVESVWQHQAEVDGNLGINMAFWELDRLLVNTNRVAR